MKDEDEGWPCCEAVMTQLVLGEWICDRLTVGAEIMNGLTLEFGTFNPSSQMSSRCASL